MTAYRTCFGCLHQGKPCAARDAMRANLRGLGVTSIKWKCADRVSRFKCGDAVWAETYSSYGNADFERAERSDFPAFVTDVTGSKVVVYIHNGSLSQCEEYEFEANNNGFCKIPMGRIRPRDAAAQAICKHCRLPEMFGHAEGYFCSPEFQRTASKLQSMRETHL